MRSNPYLAEVKRTFDGQTFACSVPAIKQYGEDSFWITYLQWIDIALMNELLARNHRSPTLFHYLRGVMGFSSQEVIDYINSKYDFKINQQDMTRMDAGLVPIAEVYWKTLNDTFHRTVDRWIPREIMYFGVPKYRINTDNTRTHLLYIQPYTTSLIADDGELECVRELLETKLLGTEYAKEWRACIRGYLALPEDQRNVPKFRLES